MATYELKKTCEHHIHELKKRLKEIYTVDAPPGFEVGKVNILDELTADETLEAIYSIIEASGVHEGEIFNTYFGYLENARKTKEIFIKMKEEVEREHAADIKNIRLLIDSFQLQLDKMN